MVPGRMFHHEHECHHTDKKVIGTNEVQGGDDGYQGCTEVCANFCRGD